MAFADKSDPLSNSSRPKVTLRVQPRVYYIERQSVQNMATQTFEFYKSADVTDSMLVEASELFSEHYGIWGPDATKSVPSAKPGENVRLSKKRLRDQYLPPGADCSYVRVIVDGHLAGHAFSCRWTWNNKRICWVTQLVVHRNYRERGLAVGLLNQLRQDMDDYYGIMSSHPAACLAAAKAFSSGIIAVDYDVIRKFAEPMMKESPIDYVRDAPLAGSIFEPEDNSGLISAVRTNFFVDHTEPLEALAWIREELNWPLGELFDGCEYLLVLKGKRRHRSRSRTRPEYQQV